MQQRGAQALLQLPDMAADDRWGQLQGQCDPSKRIVVNGLGKDGDLAQLFKHCANIQNSEMQFT